MLHLRSPTLLVEPETCPEFCYCLTLVRDGTTVAMHFDWFAIESPTQKIARIYEALGESENAIVARKNFLLGRGISVVAPADLPPKLGLSSDAGQARLLHDLASIELQAMELAVRTLYEFPEAPRQFRSELSEIALSESRHLALCLNELDALGFRWGDWNVHLSLWNAVSNEDSLLDRVLIVHRYLEGSGLDAGESILRRLAGCARKTVRRVVDTIVREEVDHVLFGSRWYRRLCEGEHLEPDQDFARRIMKIAYLTPRRERLAHMLRKRAGFTDFELETLERLQPPPPSKTLARA